MEVEVEEKGYRRSMSEKKGYRRSMSEKKGYGSEECGRVRAE